MNGRIYDPLLGRFLSADTQIQFPNDLQSYNRYSYVQNNPLKYIDPTGFALTTTVDDKGRTVYSIDHNNPGNPYVTGSKPGRESSSSQVDKQGAPHGIIATGTDGALKISQARQASENFLDQGTNYQGDPVKDWRDGQNGQGEALAAGAAAGSKAELLVASANPEGATAMVAQGARAVDAVTDAAENPAKTALGLAAKVLPDGGVKKTVEAVNKVVETKDKVENAVDTTKTVVDAAQKIKDSKSQPPPPPPPPQDPNKDPNKK